ncbi:hypothetical protein HETIRDRAFT_317563 [Heterobasidion irregulare TC 32-1]|uniref:Transcription factor CBF/NF-Y/archaeal histone domain-containing protein n=1 Tax=Heterobasidion irregulare (strain TC 32-1) TaxID=747525 RepID=W4K7W3_HETIT|nr:uncharacterized protein HETIRDRAFT_317563 [Heterobasidion irregulare TC 32-1]ETW81834.1 hypothetical protein HETIRDRAFT_317563 [Heterobasidion irregulare TC 32-1]
MEGESTISPPLEPAENAPTDSTPTEQNQPQEKKRTKACPQEVREGGKSLLPLARVQRIMKADKELPIVAKEAAFLISMAAEEFIKRLAEASQKTSLDRDRKSKVIQQRDIASVVRRVDEYLFLEGEDVRARIDLT